MTNLEKAGHIVVLMLENRSFDHMLGYLSLEGGRGDVDGLRGEFANEHDGRSYPIHHLDSTSIADDPDHPASSVDLQIGGGLTSFLEQPCSLSTMRWPPARSGRKRCWSSMTSMAVSSITSRRPPQLTAARTRSAAMACGYRR